MSKNDIRLRGPNEIWCSDASSNWVELNNIEPGQIIQSGVKVGYGVDSVWVKVHAVNRNVLDGIVIHGPKASRGAQIRFRRRDVWVL